MDLMGISVKNIIIIASVGLILGGAIVYYKYNERTFDKLLTMQNKLTKQVEEQTVAIEAGLENHERIVTALNQYSDVSRASQDVISKLTKTVIRGSRNKKSFDELSKAKSTLITRKINNATKKYFDTMSSIMFNGVSPKPSTEIN